jgi:predicted nucleic acid-binding protein
MARSNVLIADAGPLIALSRIGALDLLQGVFGEAWVTSEVRAEVLPAADYPGKADLVAAFERGWLRLLPPPFQDWRPLNPGLGPGERSSIAAALEQPGCLLVIDDRAGRAEARAWKVAIIGTAAVIGLAKLRGLIPAARPLLERLQPAGYFIGSAVIEAVLADVGETNETN